MWDLHDLVDFIEFQSVEKYIEKSLLISLLYFDVQYHKMKRLFFVHHKLDFLRASQYHNVKGLGLENILKEKF